MTDTPWQDLLSRPTSVHVHGELDPMLLDGRENGRDTARSILKGMSDTDPTPSVANAAIALAVMDYVGHSTPEFLHGFVHELREGAVDRGWVRW